MKIKKLASLVLAASLTLASGCGAGLPFDGGGADTLPKECASLNDFSAVLTRVLDDREDNLALSPLSAYIALAMAASMLRVLLGIPILYFLLPGYALALLMSFFVPDIYTAIAFDSGGVASGPMTATFMLQFVIGASTALGGNVLQDAFGVVAMVAMMPLLSIQTVGLLYRRKQVKTEAAAPVYGDCDIVELWEEDVA